MTALLAGNAAQYRGVAHTLPRGMCRPTKLTLERFMLEKFQTTNVVWTVGVSLTP